MCLIRKKAILFIHGFVGGTYDFGTLPNELQLYKNFDVYTFTLPGHEKLIVNNVKFQEWIEAATKQIEFLIKNGYKTIYLVGHSMGGVIATYLASTYPQVKKLVLAAPAFKYFYFKDDKVDIRSINNTIKNLPTLFKKEDTEQVVSRIIKTPISTMLEFVKLVSNYLKYPESVTCPTLIIHGLDDNIVPTESTEYVHNSIKSKTNILINIKEVTHDCFTHKRNNEVNNLIKNFLIKKSKPNNYINTI